MLQFYMQRLNILEHFESILTSSGTRDEHSILEVLLDFQLLSSLHSLKKLCKWFIDVFVYGKGGV